jgi:hypothetical protein
MLASSGLVAERCRACPNGLLVADLTDVTVSGGLGFLAAFFDV